MGMNITETKLSDLIFAEYNPRQLSNDQFKQIKDSITRFGIVDPIIVNSNKDRKNIIIGGHQRVKVALEMGIDSVPCHFIDLTRDKERELNVRLNKNTGEWDWSILATEFDVEELTEWGFSEDEFSFPDPTPVEGLTDEDAVPEVEESITKPGDLWILGEHRVLCGDATISTDVEKLMDGQKADMVFTDPPWNVNYGAVDKNNAQGYKPRTILNDQMETGAFKDFMSSAFAMMALASRSGCPTYVVMSAQEWGNLMLELHENGYHWSSTIIWNKDHLVLSRKDYHTKYEPIWYGWKEGDARLCPVEDRKQSDVWDVDRPTKSELHPTTKPIELVERAISNSSNVDGLVIDTFLGSGSTLIACEKTGRKCYGMELDPHYCDVIVKRWEEYTGKKAELVS
jgi:DNA modification methylase